MDKQEYFLLIPAIIYGVAIVDLLKIFSHRKNYFEMVGWGVFYLMAIIILWMDLYHVLEVISEHSLSFVLIIVQAILYARGAGLITPEEKDEDTEAYFMEVRKQFFFLMAAIVLVNLLIQVIVKDDQTPIWFRLGMFVLALILALWDNKKFRVTIMIMLLSFALLDLSLKGGVF
ncbi:MAG: hypothetical protein JXR07_17905 [Reichenbachiella sp.]